MDNTIEQRIEDLEDKSSEVPRPSMVLNEDQLYQLLGKFYFYMKDSDQSYDNSIYNFIQKLYGREI